MVNSLESYLPEKLKEYLGEYIIGLDNLVLYANRLKELIDEGYLTEKDYGNFSLRLGSFLNAHLCETPYVKNYEDFNISEYYEGDYFLLEDNRVLYFE